MLLKDILQISLFTIFLSTASAFDCSGEEVSIHRQSDIEKLTEKYCSRVVGNVIIENITEPSILRVYNDIEEIRGSLIIRDTSNLFDSINFMNLQRIDSGIESAIVLTSNSNLQLAIGGRLRKVISRHHVTYEFQSNLPSSISPTLHNILYTAAYPDSNFLMDGYFTIPSNHDEFYKTWATILGFFAVVLAISLIVVSFFGRESSHED